MLTFDIKKIIISIVLALILIIAAQTFLWYEEYNKPKDDQWSYAYTVSIRPNGTEPFSIVCPILIHDNGTVPAHLIEEIYVEGNATINITETPYGLRLRAWGNGPVFIQWEKIYYSEEGLYIKPSMMEINKTTDTGTAWFYSNISNVYITTFFNYSYGFSSGNIRYASRGSYEIQDWLSSGWNKVDVKLQFWAT